MVLISRKVDYAILALVHLSRRPDGCSVRELASEYGLSRPFLANILKELCQQQYVESHRGINGGYRISADPSRITVHSIIESLEGPFHLMSCAESEDAHVCSLVECCPIKGPLRLLHARLKAVFKEMTLEDLAASSSTLVALAIGERTSDEL